MTRRQVRGVPGLSLWETEAFLKAHDAPLHDDLDDLQADRQSQERVVPRFPGL